MQTTSIAEVPEPDKQTNKYASFDFYLFPNSRLVNTIWRQLKAIACLGREVYENQRDAC